MKKIFLLSGFILTQTLFATSLTIYNSGVALVEESMLVNITPAQKRVLYDDVAPSLIDDSVDVELPPSITLNSQQHLHANLNQDAILRKMLLHPVELKNGKKVVLLSLTHKSALVQSKTQGIFSVAKDELVIPRLPKGIHQKEQLLFEITPHKTLLADITLNYLARKVSFTTDYIINLQGNSVTLDAFANITNSSGKDFLQSNITLLAGTLHQTDRHTPILYRAMAAAPMQKNKLRSHAYEGYHLFKLPAKIDLPNNTSKRLHLYTKKGIKANKHYYAQMSNPLYLFAERSRKVEQKLLLKTPRDEVMPAGKVRVYGEHEGSRLLLGEQEIPNSAKNSSLELLLGQDFDTKITQTPLMRNDTKERFDVTVLYTLTNHSNETKKVTMTIPFEKKKGSLIKSKLAYRYTKGNLVSFELTIAPNTKESFRVNFQTQRR